MRSILHNVLIFVTLAFVSVLLGSGCSAGRTAKPNAISPDMAARLGLEEHRGKVVYIDFWASWCVPCIESFPWMNDMATKYDELVIIAVNVDRERDKADAFLARQPAEFVVVFDPDGALAGEFKLDGMPSSFLLDRNGTIRSGHVGFRVSDAPGLESQIQNLIGERP